MRSKVFLSFLLLLSPVVMPASTVAQEPPPHHGGRMQIEFDALFALVAPENATHVSARSGDWTAPGTWGGGLPIDGARVLILPEHTVTVDTIIAESLMTLRVQGVLRFSTYKNTSLRVDTLISDSGSVLEMGTATTPIEKGVTARITIDDYNYGFETLDSSSPDYDPFRLGQGLIGHGRVTMHGQAKTAYASLAVIPQAGDTALTFDSLPSDWHVGDEIVVAGTHQGRSENRSITRISGDMVTLDSALTHTQEFVTHSHPSLELKVHVANLTRNAIVETDEDDRMATNDIFENRGHVMFMHSNDVNIQYAGFYHLGRTNKMILADDTHVDDSGNVMHLGANPRARYSVHFHRAGWESASAVVNGAVVWNNPGWAFVNHSSNVEMTNNVAYDVSGSAFNTEAGDEAGSFVGNIAIQVTGEGGYRDKERRAIRDDGHTGVGYWLLGMAVAVKDNIAADFRDAGVALDFGGIDGVQDRSRGVPVEILEHPEFYEGKTSINQSQVAFPEFSNMTVYGGNTAMRPEGLSGPHRNAQKGGVEFTRIDGLTGYHLKNGLAMRYTQGFLFTDLILIGTDYRGMGTNTNYVSSSISYVNPHIEQFRNGISMAFHDRSNMIRDGYLRNAINVGISSIVKYSPVRHRFLGDLEFAEMTADELATARVDKQIHIKYPEDTIGSFTNSNWVPRVLKPNIVILDIDSMDGPFQLYLAKQNHPDYVPYPQPHPVSSLPHQLQHRTNAELAQMYQDGLLTAETIGANYMYEGVTDDWMPVGHGMMYDPAEVTTVGGFFNIVFKKMVPTHVEITVDGVVVGSVIDFGTAPAGSSKEVTITNTGGGTAWINQVELSDGMVTSDYALVPGQDWQAVHLAQNRSKTFTLSLDNAGAGELDQYLILGSPIPEQLDRVIRITGGSDEPVNHPPIMSGSPAASVDVGSAYSFVPSTSDRDGDSLTFSIVSQPAWSQFDPTTGELSGVPTASDVGTSSGIGILVTDGQSSVSLPPFSIVVRAVPTDGGDNLLTKISIAARGGAKDRLIWKMTKAGETVLADLGDPTVETTYNLSLEATGLSVSLDIPADAALWKLKGRPGREKGYVYRDRALSNAGIAKLQIELGPDGKSKVYVTGRGVGLGLPAALAITPPVTVTLSNSLGVRWESTFSTPTTNTPDRFKARQ